MMQQSNVRFNKKNDNNFVKCSYIRNKKMQYGRKENYFFPYLKIRDSVINKYYYENNRKN